MRAAALILSATLLAATGIAAAPLGTAFSYQGQLTDAGQPATGLYDLQACLYETLSGGSELLCAPDFADVPVEAGLFTLAVDLGSSAFGGEARYLELRVRPGASTGAYTVLAPRQQIRVVPEALRAATAASVPWSGISGMPAGFADNVDNDSGGTLTGITAGTGLSGGTITTSGTIGIAPGGVGLAQIDSTQVQARIGGNCAAGEYVRGINSDGSLVCESVREYLGINLVTVVDNSANVVGEYTSIVIGGDGLPVISYHDMTAGALKVARCANTACTGQAAISVVDDPANRVGLFSSIAIGSGGFPVISHFDDSAGALKVARCVDAACSGAATLTTLDDPAGMLVGGVDTAIAIDADGVPVISYLETNLGVTRRLKVAKCANVACTGTSTITVVDGASSVGRYSSIAIGNDGIPVISYYSHTLGALKVAKCGDAACTGAATVTVIDDPANNVGQFTSLAIGSDGIPVISYYDATAATLKVAKCGNAACTGAATITTVDGAANNVGQHSSIAIGADDLPIISYYDATAGALKVAKCFDAACSVPAAITTIDNPGNHVGQWTSIAIGHDGLPVVSHHDVTAGSLRVLKCATPSCQ